MKKESVRIGQKAFEVEQAVVYRPGDRVVIRSGEAIGTLIGATAAYAIVELADESAEPVAWDDVRHEGMPDGSADGSADDDGIPTWIADRLDFHADALAAAMNLLDIEYRHRDVDGDLGRFVESTQKRLGELARTAWPADSPHESIDPAMTTPELEVA